MIIELAVLFVLSALVRCVKTVETITQVAGHKLVTSVLIALDTVLFLIVFRNVIINDITAPVLAAVAGGYIAGYYAGAFAEETMALGKLLVTIKISKEHSRRLAGILRENGFVFVQSKRFYSHKGKLKKLHQGIIYRKELPKLKGITKSLPVMATVEDVKSTFGKSVISSKDYLENQKNAP